MEKHNGFMLMSAKSMRNTNTQLIHLSYLLQVAADSDCDVLREVSEETNRQLHKNVASNTKQDLAATPHKAPTIRPLASHHESYTS